MIFTMGNWNFLSYWVFIGSHSSFDSFIAIAGGGHNQLHYYQYLDEKQSCAQAQEKGENSIRNKESEAESATITDQCVLKLFS